MKIARIQVDGKAISGIIDDNRFAPIVGYITGNLTPIGGLRQVHDGTILAPCDPPQLLMVLGGWLPVDGTPVSGGTEARVTPNRVPSRVMDQTSKCQLCWPSRNCGRSPSLQLCSGSRSIERT